MTRKIILSRKGFDSANGGRPSPILKDGTLLSLPIPLKKDTNSFSQLSYDNLTYQEILNQLRPNSNIKFNECHLARYL